jgi:hypothetical protein
MLNSGIGQRRRQQLSFLNFACPRPVSIRRRDHSCSSTRCLRSVSGACSSKTANLFSKKVPKLHHEDTSRAPIANLRLRWSCLCQCGDVTTHSLREVPTLVEWLLLAPGWLRTKRSKFFSNPPNPQATLQLKKQSVDQLPICGRLFHIGTGGELATATDWPFFAFLLLADLGSPRCFASHFGVFVMKLAVEEWPPLHQCWHLQLRASGHISTFSQVSLPLPQIGTSLPFC